MELFNQNIIGVKTHLLVKIEFFDQKLSSGLVCTLGQKSTFNPEITKNLMFEKCKLCEKRGFEIVNFVKNEALKMYIL